LKICKQSSPLFRNGPRSLLLLHTQSLCDIIFEVKWSIQRRVAFDRLAIAIDQKLGEIPFDEISQSSALFMFQIFEKRMRLVAVHVYLRVHVESNVKILGNPLLYLRLRPRLLTTELITGETCYAQTIGLVFLVYRLQLCVRLIGISSFTRHIHDKHNQTLVFVQGDGIAVDVLGVEFVDGFGVFPVDFSSRCRRHSQRSAECETELRS